MSRIVQIQVRLMQSWSPGHRRMSARIYINVELKVDAEISYLKILLQYEEAHINVTS